ncbi:MAG: hypothetical protein ACYCX4_06990 [Bacillota bacterium]
MERIITALSGLRVPVVLEEYDLQKMVAETLAKAHISYEKEYQLGPRNRIDFLTDSGIGIEIKKGKPNKSQVIKQIQRYAASSEVKAIICVVERNLDLPKIILGKPCVSFGLNKLWGIAL